MTHFPRVLAYQHVDRAVEHLRAPEQTYNMCCAGAAFTDGDQCTCWEPVIEPEPVTEVQEGPMPVNAHRCGDCAYRLDSPERQAMGGDPMAYIPGGIFTCHVGMPKAVAFVHPCGERVEVPPGTENDDYRPVQFADRAWQADGRPAVVCAGWAADDRAYQRAHPTAPTTSTHQPPGTTTTTQEPKVTSERLWATEHEAAEHARVSGNTLRRWRAQGRIKGYKVGRAVRYDLNEIDDMLVASADAGQEGNL